MNLNLYCYIPHILCVFLLAAVVTLAFCLKKYKDKDRFAVASSDGDVMTEEDQLFLESIEKALVNEEFKMYLQFSVDNKTKNIYSAEALSRWVKPDGEIIFPGKYIGAMEKYGLITILDYHMFEKACGKLSEWKGTDFDGICISCNFTRITISEVDFVSKVKEIADQYDFDRSKLTIEITEDSIEKNLTVAMMNILRVKELGFKTALDDIGNGYTSLMNLCEYPIDIVKIDREILLHTNRERGKKLFLGIVSLAHYLNLKVVCEGVETEEQNTLVSESDCDYIQGWYYNKAMPEIEAEAFAKDYIGRLK